MDECRNRAKKFAYMQWSLSEARQSFRCLRIEFPLRKLPTDTRSESIYYDDSEENIKIIQTKILLFDEKKTDKGSIDTLSSALLPFVGTSLTSQYSLFIRS